MKSSTIKGTFKGKYGPGNSDFQRAACAICKLWKLLILFVLLVCVSMVCVSLCVSVSLSPFFFFNLLFKTGLIHHRGISDINAALQINGSLTGPAADVNARLSL